MNKRFTVEESNLISIFMEEGIDSDVGGRKKVINGIDKGWWDGWIVIMCPCKIKGIDGSWIYEDGVCSGKVTSNVRQSMAFGGCVLSFWIRTWLINITGVIFITKGIKFFYPKILHL